MIGPLVHRRSISLGYSLDVAGVLPGERPKEAQIEIPLGGGAVVLISYIPSVAKRLSRCCCCFQSSIYYRIQSYSVPSVKPFGPLHSNATRYRLNAWEVLGWMLDSIRLSLCLIDSLNDFAFEFDIVLEIWVFNWKTWKYYLIFLKVNLRKKKW